MKNSPFNRKPLLKYRHPRYPRFGYKIPACIDRSFWKRLKRSKILPALAAGMLPLPLAACGGGVDPFIGQIAGDMVAPEFLTEAEVRQILLEKFGAGGVHIKEDFQLSIGDVIFNADGFDQDIEVGYEYESMENDGYGADENAALSAAEKDVVNEWKDGDGPYFLVLVYNNYSYYTEEERQAQLEELESDIDVYLAFLTSLGII